MKAVYAEFPSADDPLAGLRVGEQPAAVAPSDDWAVVTVRATSINQRDLQTLRGCGRSADKYPTTLGTDASGLDEDGRPVILGSIIAEQKWMHEPVRDLNRTVLGDGAPGTFAEQVSVPRRCLVPKPDRLSFEEATCLSTTWLTAYRMLFTKSGLRAGDTVLIQGAGGGVSTALIRLASAAGLRVWVTGRSETKREAALAMGAHRVLPIGARLPGQVDAVMESVGRATWTHTLRSVRAGGVIVVTGATTGANPIAHLNRIFWSELNIVGVTSGTIDEFGSLLNFMELKDLRPDIAAVCPFADAGVGFRRLVEGDVVGKIVLSGWETAQK
jgi:NADPH:quinone reductase-like Zn-dependent oxidoreductase